MTSLAAVLVNYQDFLRLPDDDDNGGHYELHDGEVVLVPPARPLHVVIQLRLVELLRDGIASDPSLLLVMELSYKPAPNFQFWRADIAIVQKSIREEMAQWDDYRTYAPILIIEVESPSNTKAKVARQRLAAFASGTQEFWLVSARRETITITTVDGVEKNYYPGDSIEILGLQAYVSVNAILFNKS